MLSKVSRALIEDLFSRLGALLALIFANASVFSVAMAMFISFCRRKQFQSIIGFQLVVSLGFGYECCHLGVTHGFQIASNPGA